MEEKKINSMNSYINLNLYCDEIKEVSIQDNILGDEKWAYIGLLIVPESNEGELLSSLLNKRCANPEGSKEWGNCSQLCEYHEKNDREVHYQDIESKDVFFIAKRWIDFLLNERLLTYFYILGIDLMKLDYSCFGEERPSKMFKTIYNRFFRTAVLKSVKSYFHKFEKIIIKSIVHDKTELEYAEYFPRHSIYRIGRDDEKIEFGCDVIEFMDSNHHNSCDYRSNLLQYIDIILGATFNALHWASKRPNKTEIALQIKPLIYRLMNAPGNVNSHYKYVGRQSIDFFPSRSYKSLTEWERESHHSGGFYKMRAIRVERLLQPTIFDEL